MWKIHFIVACVICTVCGFLFLPIYLVISVLFVVLTGIVFFHDLPLSVHVASIRVFIESFYSSAVNTFHQSNQNSLSHRRQLHSNGILKNHIGYFADKQRASPNLISRNKLCNDQDLPDSFIMPLKNCNAHSTPLGIPKGELGKRNQSVNCGEACTTSWSDQKSDATFSPKSVPRNVQNVAGPLLVSTRFNSGINAELSADVSSMGFSSRVAQKGSARDGITHQQKYSGIGVFPIVQLNSRSPKHSISPRNSPAASKAVRVRIAPPDNSPFGGLENTVLSGSGDGDSMKSVLQVLKEMSRKRIHSQVDEEDDDKVKRQKKETYDENTPKTSLDAGLQNKRGRDDSPRSSEEVKRQRRQTNTTSNNEIMSSLSSSLAVKPPHLIKGTKRKAHAVDWSRSTTPVSGKLLKVNVSPVNKPLPQNSLPLQEEEKLVGKPIKDNAKEAATCNSSPAEISKRKQPVDDSPTVKSSSLNTDMKLNDCIRIEAGQRRVLARTGDVKEVPVQEVRIYDCENDVSPVEPAPAISLQRIKDPGRRLKDMLAAIDGNDDIDANASNMSPSVIAILKTAKTSKQNNQDLEQKKSEASFTKSPVSILKTGGKHENHKTVTFSDQVSVEKHNVETVSCANSSPQTCLTTATVVSNSINTSISSASETVPFEYGTFRNANSMPSSPNLTFATSTSTVSADAPPNAVPSVTLQQSSQAPSSFNSGFSAEGKSSCNQSLFPAVVSPSNKENSVKVSGPSNQVDLGKIAPSVLSGGFSFGSVTSPESTQLSALKSPATGLFGMNSNTSVSCSTSFSSPATSTVTSAPSVSTSFPLKSGSFSFNAGSKPTDTNSSLVSRNAENKQVEKPASETLQKPQFGGFGFGNNQSLPSNNFNYGSNLKPNPAFGGFGTPSSTTAVTTANSGTVNSLPNIPQPNNSPSFLLSSSSPTGTSNANSLFSFGSNSPATNQSTSVFGSVISQPSTQSNIFGGTSVSTVPQTDLNNMSSTSHSQPTLFGSVQSSILSTAVSNSNAINPTSVFGSTQTTPASTTPTFGSSSIFSGMTNKTEGFASISAFGSPVASSNNSTSAPVSTTTSSLFNSFSSSPVQSGGFGNTPSAGTGSSFPSASTPSAPVFGQAASSSLFSFGSPTVTTQSSMFAGSTNPVNSSASAINGPANFSTFAASSNNNVTAESDKTKPSPFSGSFQTPSFNFGSSAPSSNAFSFGSSSNAATTATASAVFNSPFKPPEQKPFGFDATQTSLQNSAPIFAFGQNNPAQPSATPSFHFNTATTSQQPSNAGIFNFGTGTNATNPPFGTGINPPTFSIGSGGTSSGSAMFNIGSGGPRSRAVSRARRTK